MPKVSVVQIPKQPFDVEVFDGVRRGIDLIGGPEAFAKKGESVVVKPNILGVSDIGATDPRITYAVAKIFVDMGCHVLVGENPLVATKSTEVFEKMRAKEVADKAGAKFVDFRKDEQVIVDVPNAKGCSTLKIAKTVMDADLLVSVPAMKFHGMCNVTLGLKNMWGDIPPTQRHVGHHHGLNWTLAELNKIVGIGLTVMDGLTGVGFASSFPLGLILSGDDVVATDAIACLRMGYDPTRIEHILYAHRIGVGEIDPKKIQLTGVTLEQLVKDGKTARKRFSEPIARPSRLLKPAENVKLVEGDVCSSCWQMLSRAVKKAGVKEIAKGPPVAFVIGPGAKPVEGRTNVIIGRCLQQYKDRGIFVDYCPTYTEDIQQGIEIALGKREKITYLWDELLPKIEMGLPGS